MSELPGNLRAALETRSFVARAVLDCMARLGSLCRMARLRRGIGFASGLLLLLAPHAGVASTTDEVTPHNLDQVVSVLTTADLGGNHGFFVRMSATAPSLLKQLRRRLPDAHLLKVLRQAPDRGNRGLAAALLAVGGESSHWASIRAAFLREDIDRGAFESAARLYAPLKLPDDVRQVFEDTSLSCDMRQTGLSILVLKPNVSSMQEVVAILQDRGRQACAQHSQLSTTDLIDLLAKMRLPQAVAPLGSLPKCVPNPRILVAVPNQSNIINRDRVPALHALAQIGGPDAFAALVRYMRDEFTPRDAAVCHDSERGTASTPARFFWAASAASAITMMENATPDQLAAAFSRAPTSEAALVLGKGLLRRGRQAVAALDGLTEQYSCEAIGAVVEWRTKPVDLTFLQGSRTAAVVLELLAGLAQLKREKELPQSPAWKRVIHRQWRCLGFLNSPERWGAGEITQGFMWAAGYIGEERALPYLVAISDRDARENPKGDGNLQGAAIEAISFIATPSARSKLESMVENSPVEAIRNRARDALARCRQLERVRSRGDLNRVMVKCAGVHCNRFVGAVEGHLLGDSFQVVKAASDAGVVVELRIQGAKKPTGRMKTALSCRADIALRVGGRAKALAPITSKFVLPSAIASDHEDACSKVLEEAASRVLAAIAAMPKPLAPRPAAPPPPKPQQKSSPLTTDQPPTPRPSDAEGRPPRSAQPRLAATELDGPAAHSPASLTTTPPTPRPSDAEGRPPRSAQPRLAATELDGPAPAAAEGRPRRIAPRSAVESGELVEARADAGSRESPRRQLRWTWVSVGTTCALLVGAIATSSAFAAWRSALHGGCAQTEQGCTEAQIDHLRSLATGANVLWGLAGAAAVTTGIVLWLELRSGRTGRRAASVAPMFSSRGGGIAFVGEL